MFTWYEYENAAAAAQFLADSVAGALQQALAEKGEAVLAVSGGRSPIAFFEALSQKDLDWSKVRIGLVDERIVPTGHADSNTGLVREYLLKNKAAAATWMPMVEDGKTETELQPDEVVGFALKHYKQPDVLVLGMGGDGHTASLFPQAPQLQTAIDLAECPALVHTTPVTAPHERVSMSLGAIVGTPHIYLAIQGEEKKAVFDRAAEHASTVYPISLILHHEGADCHVFYAH
ncbi:6-phosphogluconolactonase [Neisseria animalis]|uniref:6-phosphogluconolactonase n=1 Tax=Neisseria animalis TaxID=492 RepID=A0A5P3MS10_NEIAN|nr:6-phosphogluconolactonase [Neisseria animalis]QEY24318.1 6-phosphogluconolactonase [Neisseria animalis]ROW32371.1 6-phosphogluconolactonase [Neisseria animalis]VEE06768.1 6-phosphogluconolactonase [Neisseria animalis]